MNSNTISQVPMNDDMRTVSSKREQLHMRKAFMEVHEYRNAEVTLDREEGKSEEYITKKTKQWHDDDYYATLSTFEQKQLNDKRAGRSDDISTRLFNFGFSDNRWEYQFEDRYGILRLGMWAGVVLIGSGTGIYKYVHRKPKAKKQKKQVD